MPKRSYIKPDWTKVTDWTMSDYYIAKMLNCHRETVRRYRKKNNICPGNRKKYTFNVGRKPKYDWSRVRDWNMQDVHIARILGCEREAVRQHRIRHNISKSSNLRRKKTLKHIEFIGFAKESMTRHYICRKLDIPYALVYKWEKELGITLERKIPDRIQFAKLPINQVNWELPNKILNDIWGIKNIATSRKRHLGVWLNGI